MRTLDANFIKLTSLLGEPVYINAGLYLDAILVIEGFPSGKGCQIMTNRGMTHNVAESADAVLAKLSEREKKNEEGHK